MPRKNTATDLAGTLLAESAPPPPPSDWADDFASVVNFAKDVAGRVRCLIARIPTDGDPSTLIASAEKVLAAMGVEGGQILDPIAHARNTGLSAGGTANSAMQGAFGALAESLVNTINRALNAGGQAADPLLRMDDFKGLELTRDHWIVLAPLEGAPKDSPVHRLPMHLMVHGRPFAALGPKGAKFYRLSQVEQLTTKMEEHRREKVAEAEREDERRRAAAQREREQWDNAALRRRVAELEGRAGQQ